MVATGEMAQIFGVIDRMIASGGGSIQLPNRSDVSCRGTNTDQTSTPGVLAIAEVRSQPVVYVCILPFSLYACVSDWMLTMRS